MGWELTVTIFHLIEKMELIVKLIRLQKIQKLIIIEILRTWAKERVALVH